MSTTQTFDRHIDLHNLPGIDAGLENFFNGALMHGANSYDPYVSGYAYIKWLHVPKWVESGDSDEQPVYANQFRQLSEKNFKGFGGLADIELDTGGITSGFTGNELHYAKGIGNKPTEFTLKYQEQSGSPLTRVYNKWVAGIRDPRTGVATYAKQHKIDYHSRNHTGTLLYVNTRPDADNKDKKIIEFAAIITHVMPKKMIFNHFNYESGSHDFVEQEMSFSGYLHMGADVDAYVYGQMSNSMWQPDGFVHENQTRNILEQNLIVQDGAWSR